MAEVLSHSFTRRQATGQVLPRHVFALVPTGGYSGEEGTEYVGGTDPNIAGGKDCVLLFETMDGAEVAAEIFKEETQKPATVQAVDVAGLGADDETLMVTVYRSNGKVYTLSAEEYRARIDWDEAPGADAPTASTGMNAEITTGLPSVAGTCLGED